MTATNEEIKQARAETESKFRAMAAGVVADWAMSTGIILGLQARELLEACIACRLLDVHLEGLRAQIAAVENHREQMRQARTILGIF